MQEAAVVTLRGTVEAIDKEKQTVTIKGPKRTLTVKVQDPKKLEAIKVGDPVVGKYYEALPLEVKKPGTATPGVTAQQGMASSKPGATPAGAVGRADHPDRDHRRDRQEGGHGDRQGPGREHRDRQGA